MTFMAPLAVKFINLSFWAKMWQGVTGISLSSADFLKAGKRIQTLERYMNTREGISRKDDILPERLLVEGRTTDTMQRTVPLYEMLDSFYKIRGYGEDGVPTRKLLKKLDII